MASKHPAPRGRQPRGVQRSRTTTRGTPRRLGRALADGDVFAARLKVLSELVRHHIGEEESAMFPRLRALLGRAELRELGGQIHAARRSAQAPITALRSVASLIGLG